MRGRLNIVRISPLFEVGKQLIKPSIPRIFLKRFQKIFKVNQKGIMVIDKPNVPKADVVDVESNKDKSKHAPPAPYPNRLRIPKKLNNHAKIYELFKQVKVNIPLFDAIKQIPSYAKFLKDLCTVKRKLGVHSDAFMTE